MSTEDEKAPELSLDSTDAQLTEDIKVLIEKSTIKRIYGLLLSGRSKNKRQKLLILRNVIRKLEDLWDVKNSG